MIILRIYKRLIQISNRIRAKMYSIFPDIAIGKNSLVEKGAYFHTKYGGSISLGNNCYVAKNVQIITEGGVISIGDDCTLNPGTIIYGQGGTTIGNGVRIAAHCVIVPSNHIFSKPNEFIYKQGLSKKGIIIEDDVWLGAGVKVLDGVKISKGTVIGANAVVTKSTEPYGVYVGIPARLIKRR